MALMSYSEPLSSRADLIVYLDIKSPYAYLAKDPTRRMAEEIGISIDWRPLTLDIPSYLGSAKTNKEGKVVESNRTPRQWQGVRYAYMDAKRYARMRDIVLYGTQKIWDSSLASIAMTFLGETDSDAQARYLDLVYERFWKRDCDIESLDVVAALVAEAGASAADFSSYATGEGRGAHDEFQPRLHQAGIYGVPTYIVGEERFFGREHLPIIRWLLTGREGPAPDVAYETDASLTPSGSWT